MLTDPGAAAPSTAEPVSYADLSEFSRDLLRGIKKLHAQHGPIAALEDGGQRVVFLFSPEFNQQVLSDTERFQARFFAVRGPKRSAQRRLTCGLLAMNGDQHRRNRRLVKEPFGLRAISTYGQTISRLTDEMLSEWRPGSERDMAEEMRQFMLRVTSTLLFGLDDVEMAYRLGDRIAEWVSLNHEVGVGALVPNERFFRHYEDLLAFAEIVEAEIMQMIRRRREDPRMGSDVLSILIRTHDEEGGLSDEELVGQASVLFAAAHMTTAHSLTWTLLLTAQHPSVMARLWEELQKPQENRPEMSVELASSGIPKNGMPVLEADGSLARGEDQSLLDRIIKESMRLLPASAYSQRITTETVQLGPLHVQRGTGIVFTPIITHRLPEIYPQPERFLPDRWLKPRPSPYAYHPFGAGPRLCIGGPLATAIIRIALHKILKRFRLTVIPGSEVNAHIESTMLMPSDGLRMRIDLADGDFTSSPMGGNIHELVDFVEAPVFSCDENQAGTAAPEGAAFSEAPRHPR